MTDFIEVNGPDSLAELVARLDHPVFPPSSRMRAGMVVMDLGGDLDALVQYDEVDAATWPYMITVRTRSDDEGPARAEALALLEKIKPTGWRFQMTSDADDAVFIESAPASATER